ncbi:MULTISPECIES: iron chelate uptake ABC transporter family permease subunit [Gammaproteobacteria]|jgi:zinc transport system permease protein|uniref:High-affinity zinc uptake system membrane protein ZnuB n=1 Tax=Vreelandella halophila TaxID=86177 RepID=A0A9X4YA37_9GAMM|nr:MULTISPECIES: iron chelate uptake ABC transporter family permease subunit [Gammaproteobacteria]KAA8982866.1 iron chelate uptake ABC transporter family permease subunit [Halospina sp. K52047b]MYL25967.1 iron chelate uptake ABC transporter family permease subunit [Halomonas utahensis]MYL73471.1 iron chelate uptake ABC transporter family permease subunit [Halomonas sp. 22501_18_FS]
MIDLILNDFFWRAMAGGLMVAMVAGPLGCFVVWRRMAYFGDTLAHSALLGIALGTAFQANLNLSIVLVCVLLAVILMLLSRQQSLASDTLLGILSHSSLAIGLVVLGMMQDFSIDLTGYLFGDLLAINQRDLLWIALGGAFILMLTVWLWRGLLMITIHEELATVEGHRTGLLRLALMLMLSLVIATAMKIVGVLLITALLIIPAAAARPLAATPERMAVIASLLGMGSVVAGMTLSWHVDTPAGPSVVVAAFGFFLLLWLVRARAPA